MSALISISRSLIAVSDRIDRSVRRLASWAPQEIRIQITFLVFRRKMHFTATFGTLWRITANADDLSLFNLPVGHERLASCLFEACFCRFNIGRGINGIISEHFPVSAIRAKVHLVVRAYQWKFACFESGLKPLAQFTRSDGLFGLSANRRVHHSTPKAETDFLSTVVASVLIYLSHDSPQSDQSFEVWRTNPFLLWIAFACIPALYHQQAEKHVPLIGHNRVIPPGIENERKNVQQRVLTASFFRSFVFVNSFWMGVLVIAPDPRSGLRCRVRG